ncbi:FIP1[V]-like protein isoform X2 [Silene latifolia]|uniref:FIP1[V]-like protein isoform X2 n=1 Tax=Silene latifolia TaxID=37657 RepID=UPI003D77B6C2
MEDDEDEFGDLYTDVISTFPSSAAPPVDHISPNSNSNSNSNLVEIQEEEEIKPNDEEHIPISIPGIEMEVEVAMGTVVNTRSECSSDDSDSDDDLQIVLNDSEPLNADIFPHEDSNDPFFTNPEDDSAVADPAAATDDPNWADDAVPADPAAAKPSNPPRPNFTPYHSFHSQFKYVRPGAAPLPAGAAGPPAQMTIPNMAGRGRGDLRPPPGLKGPPMHKGFTSPFWGSNAPARGLDFTLPSHKSIFDVDIDIFEEKPWKYPGADVSNYFNFNLNAESWKDYCKQLEQLRLESTMQSKIRVYESGRTEQEYDPDLPPELAAATAMNDSSADNAEINKVECGLGDPAKAAARARPTFPAGRAIQVETGFGERIPSVDARPPRNRDSDAVIEIVLQDSDDNGDTAISNDDFYRGDEEVDGVDKNGPVGGDEHCDGYPQGRGVMTEEFAKKRSPVMGSPHGDVHNKERERSPPERASSDHHSSSKDLDSIENVGSPCEDRWTKDAIPAQSPRMSSGESTHVGRSLGQQREDSSESMEQKHSPESFSLTRMEDAVEASVEGKSMADDDFAADQKPGKENGDSDVIAYIDTSKNKHRIHSTKQEKLSCRVEPLAIKHDDEEDLKVSSSDTSKVTGNSRDNQKWDESIDEEVVQNSRSTCAGDVKRHHGEVGHGSRRKDFDDRLDIDSNYVSMKGEDYYCHKKWDPHTVNRLHVKPEGRDRRRVRENSEASWQRQDEDPHGRRVGAEDAKKQHRGDEMVSRHRRKVRETERSDKDEYFQSQILLENGKSYHEKDAGLNYREKNYISKGRHEMLDVHYGDRRKSDDYMRNHVDKQDRSLGFRESTNSRGKRDREGFLNQQKRDDHPRVRDTYDNHHTVRPKDENWVQRERAEQEWDRDEWYRTKQCYEENLSRRDREEGHGPIRGSRAAEEKIWVGDSHGREEYKSHDKDAVRHGEQLKRRERVGDEISLQHRGTQDVFARGNQTVIEGRRPRQEESAARKDRAVDTSENRKFNDKILKDNYKKTRDFEAHSISGLSKRHKEEDFANDTQDSKRGRSKLERWTSHKDRDLDVNSKSSSLKIKETSRNRSVSGSTSVVGDERAKNVEDSLGAVDGSGGGLEVKDEDARATNSRCADMVEKLKRRKERFKQELPSEKDTPAVKKTENEPVPETPANAQVKQERPPRKRRWLSS